MPQQVPGGVLHPQLAEMNSDTEKRNCSFASGPAVDWQTPDQHKAATIEYLVQQLLQSQAERGQWKVIAGDEGQIERWRFQHSRGCSFDFGDLGFGKLLNPIVGS